jgi:hypothetical protein
MGSTVDQILVPFRGEGSGAGELTWGQQGIWTTMERTGRTMNIGGVLALPEGSELDEFEMVLRFLVSRHQSLRTRLRFVDDALPQQVVSEAGEVPLDVVGIDATDDADAAAEDLRSRYEFTPFDHAHEWPVRMGVIRRENALTHLVVQYGHLAVDGLGIEAAVRDLAHLDRATGTATVPVAGVRPLELAAHQRTGAGQRQSGKSLRYWENLLRTIPIQKFGGTSSPQQPRFWEIVCRSPAMHLAMRAIAARTRTDTSHVLLAAYAVTLARITGRNPSVAQVLVNNRFRPGFADSVSHLTQASICAIDVADAVFDEVVARAWKVATNAYLHGYYNTLAQYELVARVDRDRGAETDISYFVNDRRDQGHPPGPPPTDDEIQAARPLTTLRWDRKLDTYDGTFYLHVDSVPDGLEFAIWADTGHFAPDAIQACARELEAVTVEAALDPHAHTRIRS